MATIASRGTPRTTPRGVDRIGLSALLVAALAFGVTLLLLRPAATPSLAAPPPTRDQWYLESSVEPTVPPISEQPRDRWYDDDPMPPAAFTSVTIRYRDPATDTQKRINCVAYASLVSADELQVDASDVTEVARNLCLSVQLADGQ